MLVTCITCDTQAFGSRRELERKGWTCVDAPDGSYTLQEVWRCGECPTPSQRRREPPQEDKA